MGVAPLLNKADLGLLREGQAQAEEAVFADRSGYARFIEPRRIRDGREHAPLIPVDACQERHRMVLSCCHERPGCVRQNQ